MIKFRGQENITRHWVFGSYIYQYMKSPIIQTCKPARGGAAAYINWKVNPETVGQFTGLKDFDDKEIFEGDIIQNTEYPEDIYEVAMIDGAFRVLEKGYKGEDLYWTLGQAPFKVIGNIHDNPELLKEGMMKND